MESFNYNTRNYDCISGSITIPYNKKREYSLPEFFITNFPNGIKRYSLTYRILCSTKTGIFFKKYYTTFEFYNEMGEIFKTISFYLSVEDYHVALARQYTSRMGLYTRDGTVWTYSYEYALKNF